MTDCLRKLGELLSKIDLSKIADLAKKLGISIDKLLKKIGNINISNIFSAPDFGKIKDFFKDLIPKNINFDINFNPADLFKKAGRVIEDAADYLKERVRDVIDSFKSFSVDISIAKLLKKLGITLEELARKLGMTLEEFFEKITNIKLSSLALKFPNLSFGMPNFRIADFLKETGMDIIEFFKKFGRIDLNKFSIVDLARKLGTSIADLMAKIGNVDFLSVLEDVFTAPFRLTESILKEINDQINKYICNGKLVRNLGVILGDIEDAILDALKKLSATDLKKLLGDANFGKVFENFVLGTVIVDTILNNIKDFGAGRQWINSPTNLTINNDAVPTSITTNLASLSGLIVDQNAKNPITDNSNLGGPWDIDTAGDTFTFNLNSPFIITNNDMELITQDELTQKLNDIYEDIYSSIDFNTNANIKNISPVRDVISLSEIGDYIFNVGITGDTSYTLEDEFYRTEITLVYGVSKRFNIFDDINTKCIEGSTTKMISFDSISFFGLGESLNDSRYNAYLEARHKSATDISNNINLFRNTKLEA